VPGPAVEVDVAVVGAGPAGTAAAITLAHAGANVALVDKATFPRDKCCGDGLTTGALRLLEQLGVSPLSLPSWQTVDAAWVRSPSGRVVELPLPTGRGVYAAVARRAELDALLVDGARDAGAHVHEGSTLTGVRITADAIELDVDEVGTISARMAIGADGMWSPLRKMLGAAEAGYLGEWHAFRQYFADVGPAAATHLWVWFEPDLLPGYAWSFPLAGGHANVGFGVPRGGAVSTQAMKQLWPDLLARPHVRAVLGGSAVAEAPHKAWPIPARVGSLPLTARRALFVGDAAGATDRLTGEGIGQALLTGALAADAILHHGLAHPEEIASTYREAVLRSFAADHRMSVALGKVLERPRGARAAIRVAGMSVWTRKNFARWLFEDEPRGIVLTPRRWHRHFLDRDGAFAEADGRPAPFTATTQARNAPSVP
jgi:geranylgeranyl reductase family protein